MIATSYNMTSFTFICDDCGTHHVSPKATDLPMGWDMTHMGNGTSTLRCPDCNERIEVGYRVPSFDMGVTSLGAHLIRSADGHYTVCIGFGSEGGQNASLTLEADDAETLGRDLLAFAHLARNPGRLPDGLLFARRGDRS
jgi:uncharacterized protein YbdZ (MbtH family)